MALGTSYAISIAETGAAMMPPGVEIAGPADEKPIDRISPEGLVQLGQRLSQLWVVYRSARRIWELRLLRSERQYLGIYDPEVDKELQPNRSRAYPRITRIKCISVLSRLMSLMFPGDERNWAIQASPNEAMSPDEIKQALSDAQKRDSEAGGQPPEMDADYVQSAVQDLADKKAAKLADFIDDQLQEIGGDQSLDYISLNRKVIQGGIQFGLGLLKGPMIREKKKTIWTLKNGVPTPTTKSIKMPVFEFMKVWDFYPDLSAKTLDSMDGYFERLVMSRSQLLALSKREDFFTEQIDTYLQSHATGNYKPQEFEQELRVMGIKVNVNELQTETSKYEILAYRGKMAGNFLVMVGVEVPDDKLQEEIDSEIWMIEGHVIKAVMNPWITLGVDVKTLHWFLFDEDDTSPCGFGLPTVMRDTQMSISAAVRMLMDNASVVCGPQLELNTDLLRLDQDLDSISAYKIWYRTGEGADSQWPAVRPIEIDAHLDDLIKIIELFLKFADAETFVGPATGGDMDQGPSEPFRTAAGASMLRGDAALPFKDIVRSYDRFTQSVILSVVLFNKLLNKEDAGEVDYDIIARGATSLMAKELRGIQIDQIATTLTPEEKLHVNWRKLTEQRFKVRDLFDLLVSESEADRREAAQNQAMSQQTQQQSELVEANIRKLLSDAFKNVAIGQKNTATANTEAVNLALQLLEQGVMNAVANNKGPSAGGAAPAATDSQQPSQQPGDDGSVQGAGIPPSGGPGQSPQLPGEGAGPAPGGGQGIQQAAA